mmetsp:Transcript_20432/g.61286  ORF Transcript_20432/g.61286 Transcript_20432/m.61286 type:complete len:340 (+) Transcript_20432:70-1089(+)
MQAQAPSRQEPGSAVEAALLCIPQSPSVSRVRRSASGASVLSPSPRSKPPRLQLVLDIDHTLLHAAHVPGGAEAVPIDGVHSFLLDNPRARRQDRYQVRTRHGLHSFLHEVQKFADVHIYTMAAKSYTRKVLNAIDPEVRLIRGRVLCREDNQPDNFSKSLSHLQPADAEPAELDEFKAAYLVVDDRDEVWDNVSRPHVLQVPAFRAFDSDSQQAHIPPRVHDSSAAAWEADGGGGGGRESATSYLPAPKATDGSCNDRWTCCACCCLSHSMASRTAGLSSGLGATGAPTCERGVGERRGDDEGSGGGSGSPPGEERRVMLRTLHFFTTSSPRSPSSIS